MNWLQPEQLFASLIWGSVGSGYLIYGWRQRAFVPFVAGLILVAGSYFTETALGMSLLSIATLVVAHSVMRRLG